MLAILSVLSGVNQGVCYSYAPIATISEARWEQHIHSTELITVFFVAYIPCSFLGSWLMDKKGLRYGVVLGASLQALGALTRYFATFFTAATEARITSLGQIVASIAMPFMVNSPPVLSANWFPPSQRATSTSIAVNTNAIGTALVYLTAPFIVQTKDDIPTWNACVAVVAITSFLVAFAFFRSFPRSSSSRFEDESMVSDVHLQDEYDWKQWGNAFLHKGFWNTAVSFSVAECVVNAISALLGKFLRAEGYSKPEIGLIGAAFIASTLIGGHVISQYVDRERKHVQAMQSCLLLTAVAMAAFKLTLSLNGGLMFASLMLLGVFLGPLQPVALELGVECAFPTSEATVAALQQLCGNLLSAVLVPGLSLLRRTHADASGHVPTKFFYASPEWIMAMLMAGTFVAFFSCYNGEYKRFDHESGLVPEMKLLLSKERKETSPAVTGVKKYESLGGADLSNGIRGPEPVGGE
ncbi:Major facilitator superfamily [Globisporangium polare]